MTISTLLANLRIAKRKDSPKVKVTLTVFRDDGYVPVRLMMGDES